MTGLHVSVGVGWGGGGGGGVGFFFFKQKTAYEIGTGDWSSDVCLPISYVGLLPAIAACVLFGYISFSISCKKQIYLIARDDVVGLTAHSLQALQSRDRKSVV